MGARPKGTTDARVYLDYTQSQLDLAYSQRDWASNADEVMARWSAAHRSVRAGCPGYVEHRYGPAPEEVIDFYAAPGPSRGTHFHVHGGAWRAQSKEDCAGLAPGMLAAGFDLVAPEFGKLPDRTLPHMVAQVARAFAWTCARHRASGRSGRVLVSGHSSGAHLVAMLSVQDWTALGVDPEMVCGILCVSGAYDLEPVLLSSRRTYMHLSPAEAEAMSPIRHVRHARVPVHVAYGRAESPEFIRQGRAFAQALARCGKLAGEVEVAENHFEIVDAMANPDHALGRLVLDLLEPPRDARVRPPPSAAQPPRPLSA